MTEVNTPDITVVIPVYRSAATLGELARRLFAVVDGIGLTSEIILVDDGSPDDSWRVLEALYREHPHRLLAIQLMRNYGQHNALMAGFRHATGALIVTMDDDLQHPPEEIPKLLHAIRNSDLDLVYGCYDEKMHSLWRNLASAVLNGFYRFVFHSRVRVTAFRVIRRQLLDCILTYSLNYTYIDGLLAWNSKRIGAVVVEHRPRCTGRSGYSLTKLLFLALNLFTNFSLLPLQLASGLGLTTAVAGLAAAVYYFVQYLRTNITVPGYASIIIAILVLGGIQLLCLGIMGEYLGRLHMNVNRKPQYFERQVLGLSTRDERTSPRRIAPSRSED